MQAILVILLVIWAADSTSQEIEPCVKKTYKQCAKETPFPFRTNNIEEQSANTIFIRRCICNIYGGAVYDERSIGSSRTEIYLRDGRGATRYDWPSAVIITK